MLEDNVCLQCKKPSTGPSSRLVQDACGHKKCRVCLLEDEEKCKQCITLEEQNKNAENQRVTYKNNQTAVIQHNGVKENNVQVKTCTRTIINKAKKTIRDQKKRKSLMVKKNQSRSYNAISIPNHISVNLEPFSYHCSICDKNFTTKAHVKYHAYCAGAVKPYKCDICHKEFILKTQLEVHTLKHTGMKPHKCTMCTKSFSERSKLNRHIKLHNSAKPHVCTDCGKQFKTKDSLRLHSIIHKEERPYCCNLCPAKFNNLSNLKKHLVSHSAEKVHMCEQCGSRFKLKWALSVHRKSHLEVREHKCPLCSKTFVNKKDLQRHSGVHHTKVFTCSICNTSFRRKDNLSRHLKNIHPGKVGEIIKNVVHQPFVEKCAKPVENPNAINVITAPPAFSKKTELSTPYRQPESSRVSSVINGPIKLAFKTPAFKNNYNIHRDSDFIRSLQNRKKFELVDSVNVYQRILSPHSPPPPRDDTSTEICQKILGPHSTASPIHYETSFQNRTHAMIKNIKFKVPIQYTNMDSPSTASKFSLDIPKDLTPIKPVKINEENECFSSSNSNSTYTELKSFHTPTSVIVNANQPLNNMHWRRRTSQNLNLKSD